MPRFDIISEKIRTMHELLELTSILVHGEPSKDVQRRYILVDNVVYYLTDPDGDIILMLYVPKHLRALVVKQYYIHNGHVGVLLNA